MDISKRGTQTSSLKNVIHVLVLGNRSGILLATSNQTAMPQEGRVVFIRGSITDVRLGNVSGQRALRVLLQWSTCTFIFTEVDTTTAPEQTSLPPPPDTGPLTQKTPTQTTPENPAQHFSQHETYANQQINTGEREVPPPASNMPSTSLAVPRRLRQDADSFQRLTHARLSRLHMHLFLLIDGERNIHDLAQLLHRSESDTERFLFDLKIIGIIRF